MAPCSLVASIFIPTTSCVAEPCEKTYCAYGASCVQTADGRAECQCPSECPAMVTPVCGTDGVTYKNHCMLRMKSCRQERNTRVQHTGECGEYQDFLLNLLVYFFHERDKERLQVSFLLTFVDSVSPALL